MGFCKQCGAQLEDDQKFCPACGAQQGEAQQAAQEEKKVDLEGADVTNEFDKEDIEKNKIFAVLAYLSWLVLVPIFAAKDSKFARFHVNQGLVLAIAELVWWVAEGILGAVLPWQLHWISTVLGIINILFFVLLIIGIVNAANGKAKELPIIGKFRIFK